jgi:hypothetical protein
MYSYSEYDKSWALQLVKVTLRPTIRRPVRLGVRRLSGTRDQFFVLLEFFLLDSCGSVFCSVLSDERTRL